MPLKPTVSCPHCDTTWPTPLTADGTAYVRTGLQELANTQAAHLRDAHGDEERALRCERYAISPPPGGRKRRPS